MTIKIVRLTYIFIQISAGVSIFYPLEVAGHDSETRLHVGEN